MKVVSDQWVKELEQDGFAIVRGVIDDAHCAALIDGLESLKPDAAVRAKAASTYAVRRLCEMVPCIAELARSAMVRSLIEPVLGASARVVRSLLFDKTPDANWKVPWHQDLTIAVKERREIAGFGPWSVKSGVPHVQPPVAVLESMLTLRLHLDDCSTDNAPLRVVPCSHQLGTVDQATIIQTRTRLGEITCTASRGDALLMRPLLLHASSAATIAKHRRVIHLEFAACNLPVGLEWRDA